MSTTDPHVAAPRSAADWSRMADHDHGMEDKEVNLAQLEIDVSK